MRLLPIDPGYSKIESTVGVEIDDALESAEKIDVYTRGRRSYSTRQSTGEVPALETELFYFP
jgi:hypothetical protein